MPNWCSTTYRFHGTKEELETLNAKIKDWTSSSKKKTDFGDSWLGNIVIGAGLENMIDNPDKSLNIRCRGTLIDLNDPTCENDGDYTFELWTETAWVPMPKMWLKAIEALNLKTVGFSFFAEEPDCELYWVCDPHGYGDFLDEQVYIDGSGDSKAENICGYYTMTDTVEILNRFFKTSFDSIEPFYQLCEDYMENNGDDVFLSIHIIDFDNEIGED